MPEWLDERAIVRIVAIVGGGSAAVWGLVREVRRRRAQARHESGLRQEPATEAEELDAIAVFAERHRRYRAGVIAVIVGFVLLGIAAVPGAPGVLGLVGVPLIMLGFVVGIEAYKCPPCGGQPLRSWSLGASDHPDRCGQCGVRLR